MIDPVSAYLKGVDDNRNAVLRGVFAPLNRLAERLDAAVVLVSHLTKGGSANGKHRVLGSIAYVGACRANHLFVSDPHDPAGRRVLMLDNGGNLAAGPDLGLHDRRPWQRPTSRVVRPTGGDHRRGSIRPEAALALGGEPAGERLECDDWLRTFLADGLTSTTEVFKAGHVAGFSKDQVRRAKVRLGAVARKEGFDTDAQWSWELPTHAPSP